MDGSRFDGIVRTLATGVTRHRMLHGLAGGAFAGQLAHFGSEDVAAACVNPGKIGCDGPKNRKCCQGARCKGGNTEKPGRCVCTRSRKWCGNECVNLKNDKRHCGACNKRCKGSNTCKGGRCTSKLGCKAGQSFCTDPDFDIDDPDSFCGGDLVTSFCVCLTDVNGVARCADLVDAVCSDCTSHADCPDGFVCFDASGGNCGCPGPGPGTGNACIRADCQGVSGSGTGRGGLTTPLLR